MSLASQAYAQYANTKATTAKPAELTLMLYDGAIKFCNIAESALEVKDNAKAHENIMKVQKIIAYLQATLDMKYEVAKDFDRMYTYIDSRLIEANVQKDIEIVKELNGHLHAIRDTWIEVMKRAGVR
ncbi:MAG: flagellar export chaperone FliS [Lachnospiraceae bacterium]|jgi:flagellar protein FliS|nr:flagellar export chaperone FliS [Lachnospiraceae bacterium]